MLKNKFFIVFFILPALVGLMASSLLNVSKAKAADEKPLVVSPEKIELAGRPGQKIKSQLTLINRGNQAVRMKIVTKDFKVNSVTNQVEFYQAEKDSMAQWLIPEFLEVSLKPLQSKDIQFIVSIPKEVKSGGHFGAILFEQVSKKTNASKSRFGELILLTVVGGEGKVYLGGKINDFSAPWLSGAFPVGFSLNVKNLGNTYYKGSGAISVKNWQGKEVANLKTGDLIVYLGASKTFSWKWTPKNLGIGFYRAELDLAGLGKKPQKLSAGTWFIFFPWESALVAALIGGAGAWVLIKNRKRIPFAKLSAWFKGRVSMAVNFLKKTFFRNERMNKIKVKLAIWLRGAKKIKELFKKQASKESRTA